MKFCYVIFDMDGLLVDSEQLSSDVITDLLAEQGYAVTDDFLHSLLGKGSDVTRERFAEVYPDSGVTADTVTREYLRRVSAGSLRLKPGALELLDFLETHGIRKCVASSNSSTLVDAALSSTGIHTRFDFILHGEMVDFAKPAPDLFLAAARCFGASPENCLVLEDSYAGIQAASAAGTPVIMIPDQLPPTADTDALCMAVFDSLAEVIPFLLQE